MGSENEVEMAGVSEVSLENLENMELIDEENMPNDMILLLKILIASPVNFTFNNTRGKVRNSDCIETRQPERLPLTRKNVKIEEDHVDDLLLFINSGNEDSKGVKPTKKAMAFYNIHNSGKTVAVRATNVCGLTQAFYCMESKRVFLRSLGCLEYLLLLEEELCHFFEAAELARSLVDVIKEADLLEKDVVTIFESFGSYHNKEPGKDCGKLHAFVPVAGTGGTVADVSRFFKEYCMSSVTLAKVMLLQEQQIMGDHGNSASLMRDMSEKTSSSVTGTCEGHAHGFRYGGHQVNNFDITDGSLKGGCVASKAKSGTYAFTLPFPV
nr:UvrD-like helicase, ATP-binding domain, P-loop containing nucleoside triphosphate hydrolase [Tanacetum cinerariifolium]